MHLSFPAEAGLVPYNHWDVTHKSILISAVYIDRMLLEVEYNAAFVL